MSEIKFRNELESKEREIKRKRQLLEANIIALRNEFESVEEELNNLKTLEQLQAKLQVEKPSRSGVPKKK